MVRHYRKIFSKDEDVYDWIVHDLEHMGISPDQYGMYVKQLKEILKLEQ